MTLREKRLGYHPEALPQHNDTTRADSSASVRQESVVPGQGSMSEEIAALLRRLSDGELIAFSAALDREIRPALAVSSYPCGQVEEARTVAAVARVLVRRRQCAAGVAGVRRLLSELGGHGGGVR